MGHLIDDLGERYVSEYFSNAFFMHQGVLHKLQHVRNDKQVDAYAVQGKSLQIDYNFSAVRLPPEVLDSFKSFKWPKLGYRNVLNNQGVILSGFVNSVRSTRRGLADDLLEIGHSQSVELYMATAGYRPDNLNYMYQVFFPTWFTYKQAMAKLQAREAVAVALNEDLCIAYSVNADNPAIAFDVLFRERVVGGVMTDGNLVFKNKNINKMKLFRQLGVD